MAQHFRRRSPPEAQVNSGHTSRRSKGHIDGRGTHCPQVKEPVVLSHMALRLSSQMPVSAQLPPVAFLRPQTLSSAPT